MVVLRVMPVESMPPGSRERTEMWERVGDEARWVWSLYLFVWC